VAKRGGL